MECCLFATKLNDDKLIPEAEDGNDDPEEIYVLENQNVSDYDLPSDYNLVPVPDEISITCFLCAGSQRRV